jgi:hypothetical protein
VFLAASIVFFGMQLLLTAVVNRALDIPGGARCADAANFYRPPCPQQFAWVWISSVYLVLAGVVGVLSYRWRRDLIDELGDGPAGHGPLLLHARHVVNVLVPGIFGAVLVTNFLGLGQYGPAFDFTLADHAVVVTPLVAAIVAAGPPVVSIFDIHTVARGAGGPFVPPDAATPRRIVALRQALDRFLLVLGALLGAWLVASAANGEYLVTVTELVAAAGAGGEGAGGGEGPLGPTVGNTVIAGGVVLSALLALLYVPTALAVDDVAAQVLELRSQQIGEEHDPDTAEELRERLRAELASGRSVTDRFSTGLSIAAPLTSAVFTTFVL